MPDAEEIGRLRVACCRRAQKCISRTVVVARDYLGELGILSSERSACICGLRPVQAAVLGRGNLRVPIHVYVTEVDGVVRACRNGRVTAGTNALGVGHGLHDPAQTVVDGDGHSWPANAVRVHALLVGNVGRTVRRDTNVSVQTAASSRGNRAVNAFDALTQLYRNTPPERSPPPTPPVPQGRHHNLRSTSN